MSNGPIQKGGDKVKVEYPLKQGLKQSAHLLILTIFVPLK